jgi:hypothetical protein
MVERHVAAAVAALGRPENAAHDATADLHVRRGAVNVDVAPLQRDRLADPQPGRRKQPEEHTVTVGHDREQHG